MKLKPIVASMILMGLTAPAFAASNYDTQSQLDSMKAQLAKMESVLKQNQSGGFGQSADWFNRITVSGMVNVDGYYANNVPTTYSEKNSNAAKLNNANLFIHALVNEWVTGDLNFSYGDENSTFLRHDTKSNKFLDEAYVTIGNFAKNPFYFRAGKLYVPFGVYDRYPLVQDNATQLMTETSGTSAQVGFVSPMGIYASIYGLQGAQPYTYGTVSKRTRMDNFGANLGYAYNADRAGFKLDAGYLNNLYDVNYFTYLAETAGLKGFDKRYHGVSVSADARFAAFDASAKYVAVLTDYETSIKKNKTQALGVTAGVTFPVLAHATRFGLGYQRTKDGNVFALPENRYYGEYTFNISKWTDVGLAVVHDRDYGTSDNGSDRTSTSGIARLSVKFA